MKERSKNAARCRREKENAEFANLAKLLPLPPSITSQLDKASIIRLTSSYLKLRELFPNGLGSKWGEDPTSLPDIILKDLFTYLQESKNDTLKYSPHEKLRDLGTYLLQSLDGFIFVLAADAKLIYVSETASVILGFSQIDMTGNSIFEYVDKSNIPEIQALLNYEEIVQPPRFPNEDIVYPGSICLMMKCVLSKRNAGLVIEGHKVIHCRSYQRLRIIQCTSSDDATPPILRRKVVGLAAIGHSLPPSSVTEIKMHEYTYMFRAALDFKLLYVDSSFHQFTGYVPQHLIGESLYQLVHPEDCMRLRNDHMALLKQKQTITSYFRLLTCQGGWIWCQSHCTIMHYSKIRQICILGIIHFLSHREKAEFLLDTAQLRVLASDRNIQNTVALPAKRPRQQSQIANKAPSKSKKAESSYIVPSLKADNFYQNFSAATQSTNLQSPYPFNPNVSSQNIAFITSDERNVKLQEDLLHFDRVRKDFLRKRCMGEYATQTSLASDTGEAYDEYHKLQNLYNSFNSPSFANALMQSHSSAYVRPDNFMNNYTPCYPANPKPDLPHKESAIVSPVAHTQVVKSSNSLEIKPIHNYANSDMPFKFTSNYTPCYPANPKSDLTYKESASVSPIAHTQVTKSSNSLEIKSTQDYANSDMPVDFTNNYTPCYPANPKSYLPYKESASVSPIAHTEVVKSSNSLEIKSTQDYANSDMPVNFANNYTPCYPANPKSYLPYRESASVSPIEHTQVVNSSNSLEIKSTQDYANSDMPVNFANNYTPCYPANPKSYLPYRESASVSPIEHTQVVNSSNSLEIKSTQDYANSDMTDNFANNFTPCYPANPKQYLPYKESAIVSPMGHTQVVKSSNSLEIKSTQDYANSAGDSGRAELPPYVEYINKEPSGIIQTHENFSKNASFVTDAPIFYSEASQLQSEPQSSFEDSTNIHSHETGPFNQYTLNQFGTEDFSHKLDVKPQSLCPSTSEIQNYGSTDSKNFDGRPCDTYSSSATYIPSGTNNSLTNDNRPAPVSENGLVFSDFSRHFCTTTGVSPPCVENVSTANAFANSMEKLRSSSSSSPGLSELSVLSDSSSERNKLYSYISPEFHKELHGHYNYIVGSNPIVNAPSPVEYNICEEIKKTEPSKIQPHSYAPDNLVYSDVSHLLLWKHEAS